MGPSRRSEIVEVKITKVVNHGEFLQTFAAVTDGDVSKKVSYCHKSLPYTGDGVINALMMQFLAPEYVEPSKDPNAPKMPEIKVGPHEPDKERVDKVVALHAKYKKMKPADKVFTVGEAVGKVEIEPN